MNKIFTIILITLTLGHSQSYSQVCYITENFNTYNGLSTSLPSGWIGINLSTAASATANAYTSTGSAGPSGPNSFKFSGFSAFPNLHATLITPTFTAVSGDSLSFWVKFNKGTYADSTGNRFKVYAGADTSSFILLNDYNAVIDFTNTGAIKKLAIPISATVIKFEYTKSFDTSSTGAISSVNVAFDDLCIPGLTVGLGNATQDAKIKIRFNDNMLYISNGSNNTTVKIFNILGQNKLVKKINSTDNIDLSDFATGVFIVNVVSNGKTFTQKINIR